MGHEESTYFSSMFLMLLAMIVGAGAVGISARLLCAGVVGMMGEFTATSGGGWGVGSGDAAAAAFGGRPTRLGVVVVAFDAAPRARRAGGGGVLTGSGSLCAGSPASGCVRLRLLRG